MSATNYDEVAPSYDGRYQRHSYAGIEAALDELVGPALTSGALARQATSQLSELSDASYAEGIAAIERAAAAAEARGETLMLRSDLKLFATSAESVMPLENVCPAVSG